MGRKLMFFFDGTSNRAVDSKDVLRTNISKLNEALSYGSDESPQISFYYSGVGTRGDSLSMATGGGFDQIIMEAFTNLVGNYRSGDSIYLFGFSRGAAAARALSDLISNPGLLKPDSLSSFPELWKLFLKRGLGGGSQELLEERLRGKTVNPNPKVRFVGAFDTVTGTDWDVKGLFSEVRLRNLGVAPCVDHAFHLLAIDDDRIPAFKPVLWDSARSDQSLVQVWMPGVHSDVGGGSQGIFLSNVALLTMLHHLEDRCPELEQNKAYVDDLKKRVLDPDSHEITNERSEVKSKGFRKQARDIGLFKWYEFIHPIFERQYGAELKIRGDIKNYRPTNYHLSKLKEPTLSSDPKRSGELIEFWNTASLNAWLVSKSSLRS